MILLYILISLLGVALFLWIGMALGLIVMMCLNVYDQEAYDNVIQRLLNDMRNWVNNGDRFRDYPFNSRFKKFKNEYEDRDDSE